MHVSSSFLLVLVGAVLVVGFVFVNPLKRFSEARDARRATDVATLVHAIKLYQADHGGFFPEAVNRLTEGDVFMIGTAIQGCDDQNAMCKTPVTGDMTCVDLSLLVSAGFLPSIPVSISSSGVWTSQQTGYTITREAEGGFITIRSCESEQEDEMKIMR